MSRRSERTRQAILDCAHKRLSTPGDPARLDDIAKDAGITRQALHLHFRTRSALLVATAQRHDAAKDLNERTAAIRACPDAAEGLYMLIRFMIVFEQEVHGAALAAWRESVGDADLRGVLDDRMEDRRKHLKHFVRKLQQEQRLESGWSVSQIVDVLWEITAPTSYEHLVVERGWSVSAFERWALFTARSFVADAD